MNLKSTLSKSFILALLLAFAGNSFAQVFWSEDFANGLPIGWTSQDLSTNGAVWTWCDSPANPPGPDCSPIFDDGINMQLPFAATSSANGFMTVNSDAFFAPVSNPHISVLTTTAIDCSSQPVVFIKFESHIGVFDLDADGNALFRVSTNGTDYVDFNPFEGLTTGVRWSENPTETIYDLTTIAGGASTVYLQWQWTGGWEYFWNLDDIILTSENPTKPNDMQVNSNWFAVAPNARTPKSQVETFGFLADVENVGSADQTNVELTVNIANAATPNTVIYTETLDYGTVLADSLVENVLFQGLGFTPSATAAEYIGEYVITSDSIDEDPSNNVLTFDFEVTDFLFAKDRGITRSILPAASNWDDTEPFSWAYGNFYHVVNGAGWWAKEAVFGLANAADIAGETILVKLYEWSDANADGNADPDERTVVGSNFYIIEGTEGTTEADLITLPLLDENTLEVGVSLVSGTDYLLMLEYAATDQTEVQFLASGEYNHGAQILRTQELDILNARYGSMLGVNDPLTAEPYSSLGFGFDLAPIARMVITDELSKVTTLSADNKVSVFPSPAKDYIDVNLELTTIQEEITLQVVDVTGKTLESRQISGVQNGLFRFEVSQLPAGSYFMNVNTTKGSRNVPFVVQR
jgi:Secretion system C-terminal sorting domain